MRPARTYVAEEGGIFETLSVGAYVLSPQCISPPLTIAIGMKLTEIIRGSGHGLSLFSDEKIATLEARIVERKKGSKIALYAPCLVRGREVMLTPEEVVRQLYLMVLTQDLGYPPARIALEHEVTFGREKKRADIVIFDQQRPDAPYIIIEVKSPGLKEGKDQLKSYCNATGAPIGVWSNGQAISYYNRQMPNYFVEISNIPRVDQKLSDILSERWTIDDLISHDKLVNERKSLKGLVLEMEDEVLSGAGVDVFEEVFKLIFAKLFDELESWRNGDRNLEFRNYGDTETELYSRIQSLFERACRKWDGVFPAKAKIELPPTFRFAWPRCRMSSCSALASTWWTRPSSTSSTRAPKGRRGSISRRATSSTCACGCSIPSPTSAL